MAKYTKITVFGVQVRVMVKPGETVQSVLYRAQMRYIRRYFDGVTGWINQFESRNDDSTLFVTIVLGRTGDLGTPVIGDFHWKLNHDTDAFNRKTIAIASLG